MACWNSAAVLLFLFLSVGCQDSDLQEQIADRTDPASTVTALPTQEPTSQAEQSSHGEYTNALAEETSPYLLLHAHNPVNWFAWNEETLAMAKSEGKPIFLSIGYSSCHWCHVMERETFMDEEIAKYLNDNFICIKVDREERPDVDEVYMEALLTWNRVTNNRRGGGWPLSMYLTPDGRPFFGGTYFPARTGDRGPSIGFFELTQKIHNFWLNNRKSVEEDAKLITDLTRKELEGRAPAVGSKLDPGWSLRLKSALLEDFDPEFGGFRYQAENPKIPKFPEPSNLNFLISRLKNNPQDDDIRKMLLTTCRRMMMGGIYDHIGGGFHRYSVDRYWRIPHYEKMLYDNAQLASIYSEVYALTGDQDYRQVVEGILQFVDRELTSDQGGFYSSLDAESEGEEGKFYVWELEEFQSALSAEEFKLFADVYSLNDGPNFEGVAYSPQLTTSFAEHAEQLGISEVELESRLQPIRKKLFDLRSRRDRPALDNKLLTAWNGMMIRGYADAGRLLEQDAYLKTAERAADFAWANFRSDDDRLYRSYTDGQAKLNAYLIDYACLIDGLLALHQAAGEQKWLERAELLQQKQNELFWDETNGGYFYTSKDHEVLLARSKKPTDNVIPSGNSVAAGNLLYLSKQLNNEEYRVLAEKAVLSATPYVEMIPLAAPRLLISANELLEKQN